MNKVVLTVVAGAFIGMYGTAFAEEVPRTAEIVVEETEEVRAIQERRESSYAKTVITRKEMEELGGQSAADVLRRLPRIYFTGPPTKNKDVRMAGLDKEFQNVLIDGNRPPGGGEKREFALDRIPIELIERIEVLKNPTAAYDADAIGGIVNIILKEPLNARSLYLFAGTSVGDLTNDKFGSKLSANYGDSFGPLSYTIGGTRNDEHWQKEKTSQDLSKNEREAEIERTRTLTSSLNLGLALQLGKDDRVTFKPFLSEQTETKFKEKPIRVLSTGAYKSKNEESERKEMLLQSYALAWEHRFLGGSSLKLQGLYSENEEKKDKTTAQFTGATLGFAKNVFEVEDKDDSDILVAADLKMPLAGPFETEHVVSAGVKLRDKDREVTKQVREVGKTGVSTVTSTPNDSYRVNETIGALYLMDEAALTERFILTPGMRVEMTDGEYTTSGGDSASGKYTDWNPSLHALYKLGWGVQLRGSLARTIARPAFKDKVPTRSVKKDKVEEGNPDLSAATSYNFEAGIEKYLGKSGVVAMNGFYKEIDDVIEKQRIGLDPVSGLPVERPVNAGEATVKGIDFEVKSGLDFIGLNDLSLTGTYTILSSEVRDVNTGVTRKLKDVPSDMGTVVLRYDNRKLGLAASLGMNYTGKKEDQTDPAKLKKEDAFTQWDLSFTQRLMAGVSLYGSAVNFLNEKKRKVDGARTEVEEAGRTFYAGLRFEL